MTHILILPLMAYAVCGLVLSLAVHLLSLAGLNPPGGNDLFLILSGGIIPLWLPVAIILHLMNERLCLKAGEVALLRFPGCPAWMRYVTLGFGAYACMNFAIAVIVNFISTGTLSFTVNYSLNGDPPGLVWRVFSAHWMFLYAAGLAVLASAHRNGITTSRNRHRPI